MMAEQVHHSDPDDIARVWRLMEKISICMLASHDGKKIRARPMHALARQALNAVFFLTDIRGHKEEELAEDDHVCLSFARPEDGKFLVVTGRASVRDDRHLIRDLWDSSAYAIWES